MTASPPPHLDDQAASARYGASALHDDPIEAPWLPDPRTYLQKRVNVWAVLLFVTFFVPWLAFQDKTIFSWDLLEKLTLEAFLIVVYPAVAAAVVFVLNLTKLPPIAKGLVWLAASIPPCFVMFQGAQWQAGYLSYWPLFVSTALLAASLFLRHMRAHVPLFERLPIACGVIAIAAYFVPIEGELPAKLFATLAADVGGEAVVLSILLFAPAGLAVVSIASSLMGPARRSESSRTLGNITILAWPIFLAIRTLSGFAHDAGMGAMILVHATILLGALQYFGAAGIAVAVDAMAPKRHAT